MSLEPRAGGAELRPKPRNLMEFRTIFSPDDCAPSAATVRSSCVIGGEHTVTFSARSRSLIAAFALAGFGMVSPSAAQVTTTYTYDPQGQVRTVTRPTQTVTYQYDAAANRTEMTSTNAPAGRAASQSIAAAISSPSVARIAPAFPSIPNTPPPPPFPPPPPPPGSPSASAAAIDAPAGR